MNEKCDRCGNPGSDRRTLWMACFYAMEELCVPFKWLSVWGRVCECLRVERHEKIRVNSPIWGDPQGDERHHGFYTLRVCKRCRGEWMSAISEWFNNPPEGDDHDAELHEPNPQGTGVFVRENGAIKELTAAEVAQRWPNHESQ